MELATDAGSCIYSTDLDACATCSGEQDGTGVIVDNDSDDDGVCDADEVVGCQMGRFIIQTQLKWNEYVIDGLMSDWADNYDPLATIDDDSCIREGCTGVFFFNYDSQANVMMVRVFHL